MTTPMRGPSLDPGTNQIYSKYLPINVPGGVAGYDASAANVDAILVQALAQARDADLNRVDTPDNAAAGSRFDIDCRAGQPLRASLFTGTERLDVFFDYWMLTDPSQATGYARNGDGHVRAIGPT